MQPWAYPMTGRLDELWIDSQALTGNPLGDPHRRPLYVWTPSNYEKASERGLPTIYVLQGFTGQVDMWRNRSPFRPNVIEMLDALFASGEVPPALIVYVDAWTSLGGSQFLDSPATGRYHTYLCDEVVPFVDSRYRTLADREHRAISGHSSGGYGAIVSAMLRPDLFSAFATHSGDALFENCYLPDVRRAVRHLRDEYRHSVGRWMTQFRSGATRPAMSNAEGALLNTYAMAACYSADPDGSVQLPVEVATGALRPDVWERWLAWDPVRMVRGHAEGLRSMRGIWIDAGRSDEFFLDLGADALRHELRRIRMPAKAVRFELFDGGHGGIEWRYPLAVRWLVERLAP
jgi:S-formylglutathione hydrolase FrmB